MNSMWHERWAENRTGWDLNGPHPLTHDLFAKVAAWSPNMVGGRWLIPGCGRGHDGPLLLKLGASKVVGKDLVPVAIAEATQLYAQVEHLSFTCGDINELSERDSGGFDCIFDRAMLCALEGENRKKYVASCLRYLRSGGIFASIAFATTSEPEVGPPFQITKSEVETLFSNGWRVELLEERKDGACGQKILSEWLLIARKT